MIKTSEEIYDLIDERLHQFLSGENHVIEKVPASDLITFNRLDLAFKLFYLRKRDVDFTLGEECYYEHLNALSAGRFIEADNPSKNSYNRYYDEFKRIEKKLLEKGFDADKSLIPLAPDGSILNGSHRVSLSIFHNLDVYTIRLKAPVSQYDYKFFEKRQVPEDLLLLAVGEYLNYKKGTRLAIIWPAGNAVQNNLWKEFPNIVYKMNYKPSLKGLASLMREVYPSEDWLGEQRNNYKGAYTKAINCYSENSSLTVLLFDNTDIQQDHIAFKQELRRKCDIGKHAVHITDDIIETIETSRVIFNKNYHHFAENEEGEIKNRDKKIDDIKSIFYSNSILPQNVALDGGMVMEVYGLRQANDIDILTTQDKKVFKELEKYDIHDHNNELKHHKHSVADLLTNPNFYFWFRGLKFIAINQIKEMKERRNEVKDKHDLLLISTLRSPVNTSQNLKKLKQKLFFLKLRVLRKVKAVLRIGLKKVGLFDSAKKVFKKK